MEGAGGSVGEHNKMKVSVKSESEVSAGRVCYKMEIYSEENEGKRYNIQIYIESESGICQESEPNSKSMLQDGYIFKKWEWKESNDNEIYWESESEKKVMKFIYI